MLSMTIFIFRVYIKILIFFMKISMIFSMKNLNDFLYDFLDDS